MKNREREFLKKYSLDTKKFEELMSGPDSPQKVEAYFKEFADDVFAQLTADLAEIKKMPVRSREQQAAMTKLKKDFIQQRQEQKDKEAQKEVLTLNQVDSTKKRKKDKSGELVDHLSNKKHKVAKKERVAKPIKIKPKKVIKQTSKVVEAKEPEVEVASVEKAKPVNKPNFFKKVLKILSFLKPKIRLVSKKIKTKEVDTDALKKRESALKDLHDSQNKGTRY